MRTGRTVGNVHLTNGPLAYVLRNRVYLGEINHRGESFPGEHPPIVEKEVFDAAQSALDENLNRRDLRKGRSDALLVGLLFDDRGNRMGPSHAVKKEVKPLRNEERLKLLRAIATARSTRDELLPLPQASIDAIASRHGKTESWLRKHLTLPFLDPKLVEAAVDAMLPRGYGLSRFLNLPSSWDDQWRVLGLRNPRDRVPAEPQK